LHDLDLIGKTISESRIKDWDAFIQKLRICDIHLSGKKIEAIRYPLENFGYGIRILTKNDSKLGLSIAPGNELKKNKIIDTIELAEKQAKLTEIPKYSFPEKGNYSSTEILDLNLVENPDEFLLDKAKLLINLISESKNVTMTFGKLRSYDIETFLINSKGLDLHRRESILFIEIALKAKANGKIAEFWPFKYYRRFSDFDLELKISEWIKLVKDSLNAKLPSTKKIDVIFPPDILNKAISPVVGYHASGQALYKGLTSFKIDKKVASNTITIEDDGLYPFGLRTSSFDDEGNPQSKTILIKNGEFKNYIFDQFYGEMNGKKSTGNGLKIGSTIDSKYSQLISNHYTNIKIHPGEWNENEIINEIKEGILIKNFAWLNPDALTSSFGSEIRNAYLIENGEITGNVKGGQIAGFVLDRTAKSSLKHKGLLNNIFAISKNIELNDNSIMPTVGIHNIQIVGKN
jgi:predicted Zn-dependent protease